MRTRTSTLLVAGLLALGLAVLAVVVPVPLVALGPGPTFNTLGKVDDKPVIAVQGLPTYPPSGNLNLTTVSVTDRPHARRRAGPVGGVRPRRSCRAPPSTRRA